MFWDDLIRNWRRDVRAIDARVLRAAAGHVAVLPLPRRRRRSRVPVLLLLIALAIAVIVMIYQGGGVQAIVAALLTAGS